MNPNNILLLLAAGLIVATMAVHSWLGERRLIGPLLTNPTGILVSEFAQVIVRFAWHLTSAIGLVVAAALIAAAIDPEAVIPVLVATTGVIFLAAGLYDAVATRGRHIGWPFLTAIGAAALTSLLV